MPHHSKGLTPFQWGFAHWQTFGKFMSKELGYYLRTYRRRKKWTQKELGDFVGYHDSVISNFERGTRTPDAEQLETLMTALELSPPEQAHLRQLAGLAKILHNLPKVHFTQFVGRAEPLETLKQWLKPTAGLPIITIQGTGGLGKTTLALHLAYHYLDHASHFGAIIWITAQAETLQPDGIIPKSDLSRTLDDIYQKIADCLDRRDILDSPAKIFSALHKQPTLLIIDNFETVAEDKAIRGFIQDLPDSTQLLVTSRQAVLQSQTLFLEPLPDHDTLELITHEAQAKGVHFTEAQKAHLLTLTKGHAIAIMWSIGRMAINKNIEAVLAELEHPQQSELVKFCFERSFVTQVQHQPAERILTAMCLFAHHTATPQALQQVANIPTPAEFELHLERLKQLSFIYHTLDGQLGLLPLTKEFALHYMTFERQYRFIQYFTELCYRCVRGNYWGGIIANTKPIEEAGLDNFFLAFDLAHQLENWLAVQNIFVGLVHVLGINETTYRKRVAIGGRAIEAAEKLHDVEMQAWLYIDGVGWAFLAVDQPDQALTYIRQGQAIAEANNLPDCLACADFVLAQHQIIYFEASEVCWDYIKAGWAKVQSDVVKVRLYESEMRYYRRKRLWQEAKVCCEQAISMASRNNFSFDESWLYSNLGEFCLNLGEVDTSEAAFQQSEKLRLARSFHSYRSFSSMGLAMIALVRGDLAQALQHAENARTFCNDFDLTEQLTRIHQFIAQPTVNLNLEVFDLTL